MGIKVIYFVRHGETVLNAQGIRQGSEGSLTEKGREQAILTAKKFPKAKGLPEVIISSPYERARETSEIIARELDLDVEYCDLLIERRNPSEVIGKSEKDPEIKLIMDRMDRAFHGDDLRVSDEENFTDLRDRAKKLLNYIVRRPEKRLLMITHGIFLKMIASYILLGQKLTASEYNKLSYINSADNAGLTICTCETRFLRKPEWKLLVWNDILQEDRNIE